MSTNIRFYAHWLPALIAAITLVVILTGGLALHYVETRLVASAGESLTLAAALAFVGGWQSGELAALFGEQRFAAAALAAVLVTWFTFLPSFVFILAGGPLVESTHGDLKFTGPLTAITAAVVGVIVNLALFFGQHVLWPQGFPGRFDAAAALLALAAALALFRFQRGVIEVIAFSAAIGLAIHLLR